MGMATLRSRSEPTPPKPPRVTAASLPTTVQQTMMRDSAMTGLTLPGMMLEPGWTAGRTSSPMPQRGPEPSQRMSLATLLRLTAMVLRMPLVSTMASLAAWASK